MFDVNCVANYFIKSENSACLIYSRWNENYRKIHLPIQKYHNLNMAFIAKIWKPYCLSYYQSSFHFLYYCFINSDLTFS